MKFSLSQNNAGGSVEAAPPAFNTPRLRLSGRYLHVLWSGSAATHEDQMNETDTVAGDETKYTGDRSVGVETLEIISVPEGSGSSDTPVEETLPDGRSPHGSVTDAAKAEVTLQRLRSPVAAALATLAKHCPPQLGWKAKTKRQYSSLEQEDSPKITRKRRQLIGWGRPRQEEDLLSWLTHALVPSYVQPSDVPSDVHAQDNKIAEDPCDSVSVKGLSTSLASIPEERWSYWLTRPLRTTRTSDALALEDLQSPTFPPDHSQTPPIPAVRFSSAYASCFANPQRQPSVIRWKLP
ncbi:uncharacterized protein BJ212DRAFT_1551038 [Suillus subaureus]|uniref:Uncharacterized protein n=1 Tax=Suillus subaureus TaxID=48587 RepID=A0A9P7EGU9_9AGAM|nr:uncharacterized protein BJ212DRAFT_1551038 [Suillus subaureus]KAG1821178.1 hypothetical protein BJ212DRAFT_1551038 [Suillus subaureus]